MQDLYIEMEKKSEAEVHENAKKGFFYGEFCTCRLSNVGMRNIFFAAW